MATMKAKTAIELLIRVAAANGNVIDSVVGAGWDATAISKATVHIMMPYGFGPSTEGPPAPEVVEVSILCGPWNMLLSLKGRDIGHLSADFDTQRSRFAKCHAYVSGDDGLVKKEPVSPATFLADIERLLLEGEWGVRGVPCGNCGMLMDPGGCCPRSCDEAPVEMEAGPPY